MIIIRKTGIVAIILFIVNRICTRTSRGEQRRIMRRCLVWDQPVCIPSEATSPQCSRVTNTFCQKSEFAEMTATFVQSGSKAWSALLHSLMQNVVIALRDVTALTALLSQIDCSTPPLANYFVVCIDLSLEYIVTKLNNGIVLEFMEGGRYRELVPLGRYLWWSQYV